MRKIHGGWRGALAALAALGITLAALPRAGGVPAAGMAAGGVAMEACAACAGKVAVRSLPRACSWRCVDRTLRAAATLRALDRALRAAEGALLAVSVEIGCGAPSPTAGRTPQRVNGS